jgi:hypothetical protein
MSDLVAHRVGAFGLGNRPRGARAGEEATTLPDKEEEHRVAGLTRNTDWGEHWTTRISSGENA